VQKIMCVDRGYL